MIKEIKIVFLFTCNDCIVNNHDKSSSKNVCGETLERKSSLNILNIEENPACKRPTNFMKPTQQIFCKLPCGKIYRINNL